MEPPLRAKEVSQQLLTRVRMWEKAVASRGLLAKPSLLLVVKGQLKLVAQLVPPQREGFLS